MKNWRGKLADLGLLLVRLMLGVGIAMHGGEKIFPAGGVEKFSGTVHGMDGPLHLFANYPYFFAWAAALSELMGGFCIAMGFCTRLAALAILFTMASAVFCFHMTHSDPFKAWELAYLYGALALGVTCLGPGPFSLDRFVFGKSGGGGGGGGGGKKDSGGH